MVDAFATITSMPTDMQERLAHMLELRGDDPEQVALRTAHFSRLAFPDHARVLEVGCGTGVVTRALARWPGVAEVVGIDPSPQLLMVARDRSARFGNCLFFEGDGRALPFPDGSFDVVVFHTTLTHIPSPELALGAAFRILRMGGYVSIFDGDYASTTVARTESDPVQACISAWLRSFVHAPWLMRDLRALVAAAGFVAIDMHGYTYLPKVPDYLLTVVDRGADALCLTDCISASLAEALKQEARRRIEQGSFVGSMTYIGLIGQKGH